MIVLSLWRPMSTYIAIVWHTRYAVLGPVMKRLLNGSCAGTIGTAALADAGARALNRSDLLVEFVEGTLKAKMEIIITRYHQ